MTKDSKDAHISDSASRGKGESMAREIRKDAAKEWLKANQRDFLMRLMRADCPTLGDEIAGYMAQFAESECSRLASRVLELEADVTRWQLLAGKLDCKTCTPGLASRVEELELELRLEWWGNHGCDPSARYGDDGELQCNERGCLIHDFKRTPFDKLRDLIFPARVRGLDRKQNGAGAHAEEKPHDV